MGEKRTRIYARNTEVRTIDLEDAQSFVEKYHRQSASRTQQKVVSLGIFEKDNADELLGVAQFCSPRTSAKKREYSTELLRMAFKDDVQVVGGASKLIKYYISKYDPADIFTYQDTTGENTDVYEHCGFTLVKEESRKRYLVAPNKNLDNAGKNEKLSIAYAAKLGPDKILGTNMGKVFKKDKKRKTNIELFQDLGWTIVRTSGDKVYEWINPNRTYYTYKITADGSDKYYYGVSHVKIANAKVEDCLKHDYLGSGGKWNKNNKFNNWKEKHIASLKKEIIGIFKRKTEAYEAEKQLVGDSWKNDPLCLNSIPGGRYTGFNVGNSARITMKVCPIHSKTKHIGKICAKCSSGSAISLKACSIHGETKHIGDKCRKCINAKNIAMKECEIHGLTKHNGQSCSQCVADNNVSLKECLVHGETKHLGSTCQKCRNDDLIVEKECEIHGLTKHRKDKCYKCLTEKNISLKHCSVHGLTKHHGNKCSTCIVENTVSIKHCEIHGETKHYGESCNQCRSEKSITLKSCSVHGETKHIGEKCFKCRNSGFTKDICGIHGKTSFQGGKCSKCSSSKLTTMKECKTHGLTKYMGDVCSACRSQNSIDMKTCSIHGLTKHRGRSCSKCTADKASHRYHSEEKGKTKESCSLCQKEIAEGVRKAPQLKVLLKDERRVCSLCEEEFTPKSKQQAFCSNPHDWNCAVCGVHISPVPRKDKKLYSCFNCRKELATMIKANV